MFGTDLGYAGTLSGTARADFLLSLTSRLVPGAIALHARCEMSGINLRYGATPALEDDEEAAIRKAQHDKMEAEKQRMEAERAAERTKREAEAAAEKQKMTAEMAKMAAELERYRVGPVCTTKWRSRGSAFWDDPGVVVQIGTVRGKSVSGRYRVRFGTVRFGTVLRWYVSGPGWRS